jgi:HAD superfamily hydrolase (TIGR01484 family)
MPLSSQNSNLPAVVMFDLDNTLATSKQDLERSMAVVFAELSTKTKVAVITGGKLDQLKEQVVAQLPPTAALENIYLLPTSGAGLFTYDEREWVKVYEQEISLEESDRIEDLIEQAVADAGTVDLASHSYGERLEYRGAQVTFSALGQTAPVEEKEKWDPDHTKRSKLRDAVASLLPEYDVKVGGLTTIDVTKKGINKAYGVRRLSEFLNTPISSMLYVGDALFEGGNDEVVKETGIMTHAVCDPSETELLIKNLLKNKPVSTTHAAMPAKSKTSPTDAKADTKIVSTPMSDSQARSPEFIALESRIKENITGDVDDSAGELEKYSKDTSLFTRMPSLVVYPKNASDVSALVKEVAKARKTDMHVSITARSAGTDMSGGPLTTSIVAVFMKYMNKVLEITEEKDGGYAWTEPGVFYRDFEKQTLAKAKDGRGLILPSYPASRELCAMGGIVNNNSGGERTLEYGKTEDYIEEIEAVLSDGSIVTFNDLTKDQLAEKQKLQTLEGDIYRNMSKLLEENANTITNAKPKVSKNSAGYALWNVINKEKGTFNLARLLCGAQGTLALMTKAKLRLVRDETHRAMLVIFLSDVNILPEIVHKVLPFNPESFESYDDNTFKLAIRFLPQMLSQMGFFRATRLGISFLPEVAMTVTGGIPKLILMAEFSSDTAEGALKKTLGAQEALQSMHLQTSVKKNEHESEKYWIVRRESFALLRKSVQGLYASPFIDDFVVPPDSYPQFLPELNALLKPYDKRFIYTIAGHIGNGNFHIIPLMDLKKPETRQIVLELAPKVYELVIKYGGTTTGEHNDGIIRTPYLTMLFGDKMVALFTETKKIFDPLNLFNPGKKVGGTFADIERDMLKSS